MLCCVVPGTSWINVVTVDEVLALPKVDLTSVQRRKSIQMQSPRPRTNYCVQLEGMTLDGHAASGPDWPG